MIRIDDVHAIRLIAQASRMQFVPGLHHCIARYDERDRLMGGALFTDWLGGSVQMHAAGFRPNWGSRALIYLVFDYPFRQLGVKKIFALVPEWNVRSRNSSLRIGFKVEYLTEDVFNNADGVNGMYLMSMRKEDCPWLDMPMPYIEVAPQERVNALPLAVMEPVGMMQ